MFAALIEENATQVADALRLHDQNQSRTLVLKMIGHEMVAKGASDIDEMSPKELRVHAKNMLLLASHLMGMLIHGDANRVAIGIQNSEIKRKLAGTVKTLDKAANHASSRKSAGAALTNADKAEAEATVLELWNRLPLRERTRRGAVKSFAGETVSKVNNTTYDGIRRWVAKFRKTSNR